MKNVYVILLQNYFGVLESHIFKAIVSPFPGLHFEISCFHRIMYILGPNCIPQRILQYVS